jgi:MFS family permease
MTRTGQSVFYGWWVVSTAALGLFLGPTPIVVFSFEIFLRSLTQQFHSGRAAISLAFTLHNVMAGLSVPIAGRLVDRFGARRVLLPSAAIVGAILLSSKLCSRRLWQLYVFYLALGLVSPGAGPVPYGDLSEMLND